MFKMAEYWQLQLETVEFLMQEVLILKMELYQILETQIMKTDDSGYLCTQEDK